LTIAITIDASRHIRTTSCIKIQKRGTLDSVTIGAAIFVAALGAILKYAVSDNISGIDLGVLGTILIVAGVVGLIAGLALEMSGRGGVDDDRDRARGGRY